MGSARSPRSSPTARWRLEPGAVEVRRLDVGREAWGPRLHALMQASYAVEAELIGAADFPPLARTLDDIVVAGNTVFGAIRGQRLLAALELEPATPSAPALIASLVVDPGHFRQGFGRRLVEHARALVDGPLRVSTALENAPALALYEGLGFHRVGNPTEKQGIRVVTLQH